MEELELPIDIHYNKLLDWLIDRRHCEVKWLAGLRAIRERVGAGVQRLPSDKQPLAQLRDKQPLHYFHCRQILESLKTLDGDSKTLFGKFTSPRVQEWCEIVQAYEKRHVYLAECAQQLIRNVNYEVPALKQAMQRCQVAQRDSTKREQEARNNAASLRTKFIASCKEMGIQGVQVREELRQLLSELPVVFQRTVSILPTLTPALDFYQSFILHTTGRPVQQFLPMLNYVLRNGNVTVHQWKHGTEPELLSVSDGSILQNSPENSTDQIDWGDLEVGGGGEVGDGEVGGGGEVGDGEVGGGREVGDGEVGGDREVDLEDVDMSTIEVVEDSICIEDSGTATEAGDDLLESLLASSTTRSLFLDDVMELREFLSWRVREMSGDEVEQFSIESDELRRCDLSSVQAMLSSVSSLLQLLTDPRTKHLLLMKSSARYLDRLAGSVLSPLLLANKATAQAEAMAARREEAVNKALALQPQLAAVLSDTRELQTQVEQQISELYKKREVNIIGEINVI